MAQTSGHLNKPEITNQLSTSQEKMSDGDGKRNENKMNKGRTKVVKEMAAFAQEGNETFHLLSRAFSATYCFLVIAIYISLTISNVTRRSSHHMPVRPEVLLLYLYLCSCIFIILIIIYYSKPEHSKPNYRSHGSAFLRQGAGVFGLGTIVYAIIEFFSTVLSEGGNCPRYTHSINSFLFTVFVGLQMVTVICFPRLNIRMKRGLSHLGLMHLVATNTVLWIRTLIKESYLEFHELEEEDQEEYLEGLEEDHSHGHRNASVHYFNPAEDTDDDDLMDLPTTSHGCFKFVVQEDDGLHNFVKVSSPILYPFIIEFSLIAATVFYNTWRHVGHIHHTEEGSKMYRPNIKNYLKSLDWSHTFLGSIIGGIIFFINIANLALFFSYESNTDNMDELIGKIINTFINAVGVVVSILGVWNVRHLASNVDESGGEVNSFLLYLSALFFLVYSCLEIVVGLFSIDSTSVPFPLQICNGVCSMAAVVSQVVFMSLSMNKILLEKRRGEDNQSRIRLGEKGKDDFKLEYFDGKLHSDFEGGSKDGGGDSVVERDTEAGSVSGPIKMPGRAEVVILALLNLSQWLVFTFELQRSRASRAEAEYFGKYSWVILQRVIFPLCVFYRFHSAVVMVEVWKNNYRKRE